MFKRRTLVVRQKLSSVVRGYWSITRVWKMAGRSYRFGSSEIIIIFGECLERGALKRHSPSPIPLAVSVKSQPHKQHIWFLPTHEPTLKKPKELFFCQRTDRKTNFEMKI